MQINFEGRKHVDNRALHVHLREGWLIRGKESIEKHDDDQKATRNNIKLQY